MYCRSKGKNYLRSIDNTMNKKRNKKRLLCLIMAFFSINIGVTKSHHTGIEMYYKKWH